jgi:hypothetical protein
MPKALKIGNSIGATFPSEFVVKNKIVAGSDLIITHSNGSITFDTKKPKTTKYEAISDKEFVDLIKDVEDKYGDLLDELAHIE